MRFALPVTGWAAGCTCQNSALFEGTDFAGVARLTGVLFAVFLAWRRAPLILVIIGAAVMTALLRYFGVP